MDTAAAFSLLGAHHYSATSAALLASEAVRQQVLQHVLSGGDDYELVFTAAPAQRGAVQTAAQASGTTVTRIGCVEAAAGLRLQDAHGMPLEVAGFGSFDHFASAV